MGAARQAELVGRGPRIAVLGVALLIAAPARAQAESAAPQPPPTVEAVAPAPAADGDGEARLVTLVLPLRGDGVPEGLVRAVDEVVSAELFLRSEYRTLTLADIEAALEAEKLKDLLGCDDVTCSADIAGALGADRILTGSLMRIANEYLLTLRWLDAVYGERIAIALQQARDEDALVAAARRAVATLLRTSEDTDREAIVQKRRPTFWTVELGAGVGTRPDPEAYELGFNGALRLAWGGNWPALDWYFYAVGGLEVSFLRGRESGVAGRFVYERTHVVPFVELRTAIPIANQRRTRLYLGGGFGMTFEHHDVHQGGNGVDLTGDTWLPEARAVAGAWHRISHRHSVFGGYRFRAQVAGDGADPISELVQAASTESVVLVHELEMGWAVHF